MAKTDWPMMAILRFLAMMGLTRVEVEVEEERITVVNDGLFPNWLPNGSLVL